MESFRERGTNQSERLANIRKASRLADEEKNPCLHEQEISYRCLSENDYDRDKCEMAFQNYQNCRAFWNLIMKERKRNGISPALPPLSERDDIRAARLFKSTATA
ncbi:coiled-coil-helix-coiled-coil-helix domain-containing protein 7-like [Liolophura sinensis]|uniref:coiled-coil-helix-coiled-coil-helix domain-containing protein 7-like n=1 Tax=Liolophura sinensis TaxID=3198878 RepID=UPI0031583659